MADNIIEGPWEFVPPEPGDAVDAAAHSNGGGPTDGMEARVARLESDVGHIKADIADLKASVRAIGGDVGTIKADVAVLKVELSHKPSKGFIVRALVLALAVIAGLVAFQGHIQGFLGSAPSPVIQQKSP